MLDTFYLFKPQTLTIFKWNHLRCLEGNKFTNKSLSVSTWSFSFFSFVYKLRNIEIFGKHIINTFIPHQTYFITFSTICITWGLTGTLLCTPFSTPISFLWLIPKVQAWLSPAPLGGSQSILRPGKMYSVIFTALLGNIFQFDVEPSSRRHLMRCLNHFNWLLATCSELSTLCPVTEPGHPMEENCFHHLYLILLVTTHEFMAIAEGWNMDIAPSSPQPSSTMSPLLLKLH